MKNDVNGQDDDKKSNERINERINNDIDHNNGVII